MSTTTAYDLAMPDQDWMTRAEAVGLLGVSTQQLYRYIEQGRIERRKNERINRVWLRRRDVEKVKRERDAGPDEVSP